MVETVSASSPRPQVTLESENHLDELLATLDTVMPKFLALDGLVGVTLNGGLSRGYGDHLSEIDVTLYLETAALEFYNAGRWPFPLGIGVIDGLLFDLKAVDYQAELVRDFEPVALWDLSYARILHDDDESRLAKLFAKKLKSGPPGPGAAGGPMWMSYWSYQLAGDIWIHRQDPLQGHHILNEAVTQLVTALFHVNSEYVPHEKWLIHMSRSLAWTPADYSNRLTAAMSTGDCSVESVVARQGAISGLWQEVSNRLNQLAGYDGELDYCQLGPYRELALLLEKSEYSLAEFAAAVGGVDQLEKLNYEPMRTLFRRQGDNVLLNAQALETGPPESMYWWMYQILLALRGQ